MGGVVGNINRIGISKNNIKNIFISHITEEKEVAIIIKSLIEETFPNQAEIFVSSDGVSIAAGTKWLDEISKALNEADLLITLCSEMSIKRPWINFELGAGWKKNIPIIPICYLGITKKQLPQPIAMLQGMDLVDDNSLKYMFEGIAKHLGLSLGKRIDYKSMIEEVNDSLKKVEYKENTIKEEIKIEASIPNEEFYSQKDFCISILKLFISNSSLTLEEANTLLGKNKQFTQYYLDQLAEDNFLNVEFVLTDIVYDLSHKGREYLIKNGIIS